jgi:hypothetical protein
MTAPRQGTSDRAQEGPCARCIIGALVGTAVAVAMLFVTVRLVTALVRRLKPASG